MICRGTEGYWEVLGSYQEVTGKLPGYYGNVTRRLLESYRKVTGRLLGGYQEDTGSLRQNVTGGVAGRLSRGYQEVTVEFPGGYQEVTEWFPERLPGFQGDYREVTEWLPGGYRPARFPRGYPTITGRYLHPSASPAVVGYQYLAVLVCAVARLGSISLLHGMDGWTDGVFFIIACILNSSVRISPTGVSNQRLLYNHPRR